MKRDFELIALGFGIGFLLACLIAGAMFKRYQSQCEPMSNNAYQVQWLECKYQ